MESNPTNELNAGGKAGEKISLEDAIAWTTSYQKRNSDQPQSVFFSAEVFRELLGQSGATGVRIYNAINDDGQSCFVLVGATHERDLVDESSVIYDKGKVCPPYCIVSSLSSQ